LLDSIGSAPALLFIDPFGMEPLKAHVIEKALRRPMTEVLLLFADQAALRHYGVIMADEQVVTFNETQMQFDIDVAEPPAPDPSTGSRPTSISNQAKCEAIMNDAFGSTAWKTKVDAAPKNGRRDVLRALYSDFLYSAGAKHVLAIPIRRASNQHVYHLFHATRSTNGYVTMKEAVDFALKHGPIAGSAAAVMRFLIRSDIGDIERRIQKTFAGRTVRWTRDKENPTMPSLREIVLEQTAAFPSELDELKRRLAQFRDPASKRTLVYTFPTRSS